MVRKRILDQKLCVCVWCSAKSEKNFEFQTNQSWNGVCVCGIEIEPKNWTKRTQASPTHQFKKWSSPTLSSIINVYTPTHLHTKHTAEHTQVQTRPRKKNSFKEYGKLITSEQLLPNKEEEEEEEAECKCELERRTRIQPWAIQKFTTSRNKCAQKRWWSEHKSCNGVSEHHFSRFTTLNKEGWGSKQKVMCSNVKMNNELNN